jgi:hypothetical protein
MIKYVDLGLDLDTAEGPCFDLKRRKKPPDFAEGLNESVVECFLVATVTAILGEEWCHPVQVLLEPLLSNLRIACAHCEFEVLLNMSEENICWDHMGKHKPRSSSENEFDS